MLLTITVFISIILFTRNILFELFLKKGFRNMKNIELRQLINDKRIKFYEIAREIGIAPTTFTIWMRDELTDEKKEKVLSAIDSLID